MDFKQQAIEAALINLSGKFGVVGSGAALTGGAATKLVGSVASPQVAENVIQWSTVLMWGGLFVAIAGYLTQSIYLHRRDRRESAHRAQEKEMMELQKAIIQEKLDLKYSHGEKP